MTTSTAQQTRFATSADGTRIAFDVTGTGPALVLVDGALCHRGMGPSRDLAAQLAGQYAVHAYDRRGRGESGPGSAPYTIEREIEDLAAVIDAAGRHAHVFGVSSGAALALEAAARLRSVDRLALYEAPFIVDDSRPAVSDEFLSQLNAVVAAGRRAEAVKMFMKLVGVPSIFIMLMRVMPPMWPAMEAVAHTISYDGTIMGETMSGNPSPLKKWASVTTPTLVLDGGASPAWMHNAARAIANVLPNVQRRTLEGQGHGPPAEVLAPALIAFFAG